jgi:hypothetical protein
MAGVVPAGVGTDQGGTGEPAAQRPSRSEHYQRVKRELAQRDWTYVQQYADAKTEVVEEIIVRARAGGG